jgi:hypothetical protein
VKNYDVYLLIFDIGKKSLSHSCGNDQAKTANNAVFAANHVHFPANDWRNS